MRRFALIASLGLFAACGGGGKEGEKCNTDGFVCADTSTALQCFGGVWVGLPCRGADGCKRVGDSITCDMNGNVVGDTCATSVDERAGVCAPDGMALLQCRDRKLVATQTCRSCSVVDGTVKCQP